MIKSILTIAVMSLSALAKPVDLVYRFDLDTPATFDMIQTMNQSQVSPGMTATTTTVSTNRIVTEHIETRDDGTLVIGNTTKSVVFEMTGAGLDMSYDSENPADVSKLSNPTIASLAALKGIQIQLHLDKTGTILDVPNIDDIHDRVLDMKDPAMLDMMITFTDEDTIIAMNEANYKLLPTKPVEIGDHWNRTFDIPTGDIQITMNFELTLDAITGKRDKRIAEISIDGTMTIDYGEDLADVLTVVESSMSGSAEFNIHDGLFDSLTINTLLKNEMNYSGGELPDMTISVNQSVQNTRVDD